ncbi:FAD:protein FMN transferase [Candidatus Riflebacteria bacterium]
MNFKLQLFLLLILALVFFSGCKQNTSSTTDYLHFRGQVMGTGYSIKLRNNSTISTDLLKLSSHQKLVQVDLLMSTYKPESELSRFNAFAENKEFKLSSPTFRVFTEALLCNLKTGGSYDITVGPLVNLWGFGSAGRRKTPPSKEEIQKTLNSVGSNLLQLNRGKMSIYKTKADVYCDLSSLAKGFAVDRVAEFYEEKGIVDYFIELGGEVRCKGKNPHGKKWRIGIEKPQRDAPERALFKTILLENGAVATSGNYRNFFEYNGKFYSHTINSKTGCPVESSDSVLSATVVGPECMRADALATSLMAAPKDKSIEIIKKFPGYECFLLVPGNKGEIIIQQSEGFSRLLNSE